MTSQEFLQHANNSALIYSYSSSPEVKTAVKNFANSKRVKTILYLAGTRFLNLLLTILENTLIKKYGNPKH